MSLAKDKIDSLVLKSAWQRYAEFDANALAASRHRRYVRQIALLVAMFTVTLAVISNNYNAYIAQIQWFQNSIPQLKPILHLSLAMALVAHFVLLIIVLKFQQNENPQELRAAAEEIKKEIYVYRSLLQWHEDRDHWLKHRLTDIQRQTAKTFGSELILKPYEGDLPPYYNATDATSDSGFTALSPEKYLRYRVKHQLDYYAKRIGQPQQARMVLYRGLFIAGVITIPMAVFGGGLSALVAVGIFFTIAFMNWLDPREISEKINNYNQLILGLQAITDHWQSLSADERTGEQFFNLVVATEKVIWSQYNKYATELWQAVEELEGRTSNEILDEAMFLSVSAKIEDTHQAELTEFTERVKNEPLTLEIEAVVQSENGAEIEIIKDETSAPGQTLTVVENDDDGPQTKPSTKRAGLPHAFVVMPFGRKQGGDGRWYDFNAIYTELIKPALESVGFESFRADEEQVSGDILTDMFQELLLADLVIADLSIDNANVYYELGVRHAMRKRGLVHIQSGRAYMPFDVFNVRTIPYQTDKHGRPDRDSLEKDKQAIAKIARETWASDINRIHSPIFNLLNGLVEPDRKTLRTPLATGFWQEYNQWRDRLIIAQRQKRIGDILVLTEEISNPLIKEEAIGEAGRALRGMGRFELALEQYRKGLEVNPRNIVFRREEAFHLNRVNRTDEAIVKLEQLLHDEPTDTEAISYMGRIFKQLWMENWVDIKDKNERKQAAYEASHWLLKSINTYLMGYRINQNDYYPGINALSLAVVMDYLATEFNLHDAPDIIKLREILPGIKGAVHFALESSTQSEMADYWALASLADLYTNIADDPIHVTRAYQKALTAARKSTYNLKSTLDQLELLQSIGFRPTFVQAGITVLQGEIDRINRGNAVEESAQDPAQVFVFSGHTLDKPDQKNPIFPVAMEKEVRQRINQALDKFKANENDIAMTTGASAGGEIIFIEECLQRGIRVEIHFPFAEARYMKDWVRFAGDEWVTRFYAIRNNHHVSSLFQTDHIGEPKADDNPYERNERWTMYSSMIYGVNRMRLILLWDGIVDDVPGGPDNMLAEVSHLGGVTEHLNTTKFNYWNAKGKVNKALDSLVGI